MFSFTHRIHDPCLVYLPTFSLNINPVHVGRKKLYRSRGILGGYTSPAVSQISIIWCTICTFCSGNLCRHWTLFGSTYMTSIFLLSYYLLATNFPVAGDIAEPLDKRLDHVTMSSPFGQVAKTVDGWRWMNTYLPWTSWTEFWLLLSIFKGWIICELQTPGVFVKSTFITLAALLDFVKTSGVWLQRPIGIQLYNLKHVFLESRISGAEGTIKSHDGCYCKKVEIAESQHSNWAMKKNLVVWGI